MTEFNDQWDQILPDAGTFENLRWIAGAFFGFHLREEKHLLDGIGIGMCLIVGTFYITGTGIGTFLSKVTPSRTGFWK